jgi:TPR repeat protein
VTSETPYISISACVWYKKAADQGHESAKEAIDGMESGGLGSAVAAGAALGGAALLWKILRG